MKAIMFSFCVLSVGTQDLHVHGGEHAARDSMALALLRRPELYPFTILFYMVTSVVVPSRHDSGHLTGDISGTNL
jgi:hypothetical protein